MNKSQSTPESAKKKGWFRRHKILTGIGIIMLIGFMGALVPDENDQPAPQKVNSEEGEKSTSSTDNQPPETFKVGDTTKTEKFEITVTEAKKYNKDGSGFLDSTPSEGGLYIAVQWNYKNISDEQIGSFSTPSLKLVSSSGVEFSSDLGASGSFASELDLDRKILSELSPGITVKDADVFEVSDEMYGDGEGWKVLIKADQDVTVEIE